MTEGTTAPPPDPLFSAARWQVLRALVETLADASAQAREAELVRIAADDADLALHLRALLAAPRDTSTPELARLVERLLPIEPEQMPARVGPFRLLERIGAGGMGTVYLAEREHADFVQRVALKLLDGGSARQAQLASRERRILAALAHPNITAFVDAGTQDGRAWIAMEYVDGQTLIDYCDQRELDAQQRVRLFDQICAAVAHAHAQLVVHRDLKPSNVLVDAEGRAKLLDFGIALVLDDDSAAPATRVFTLEYAAPEQLRGERVTTASDVYSLGLILYELVAGKRLSTVGDAAHHGEWTTTELARLAALPRAGDSKPPVPALRDSKALSQLLRGDLGRIIAHSLNPHPAQRYASVASLREDLARWLEYRPLTIGAPAPLYLLRRFVRRHRAGVAASVLGLVAILGLAATAVWQARAKTEEAAHARAALRQSEATRNFMNSVFLSADPNQGKGAQTTAGELLAVARVRIDKELAQEPEVAAPLLLQIGNVYVSLGDGEAVKETLGKALNYNARSDHPSGVLEGAAKARLAYEMYNSGHTDEALRELAAAVALLRAQGSDAQADLAMALRMQGNVLYSSGAGDAVAAAAESVQIMETLGPTHAGDYLLSLQVFADMLASLDRNDEALAATDRGLAHPLAQAAEYATVRSELQGVRARALTGLKRYAEAEPVLVQVIAFSAAAYGAEHSGPRYWRYRHAQLLQSMGRLDEASAELQALLTVPPSSDEHRMAHMAHLVTAAGVAEARRANNAAEEIARAQATACGDRGHPMFCAKVRLLAAEAAIRERRDAAARAALADCAKDDAISTSAPLARRLEILRARLARDSGQFEAARKLLDQAQSGGGAKPEEIALLDIERGFLALAAGDRPTATAALTRGRASIVQSLATLTPQVREIDAALKAAGNGSKSSDP